MNKTELVEKVQELLGPDASKASADAAVKATLDAITLGVKKDKLVQLIGFGTFAVVERAARQGRNPATGAPLKIKASKSVKFKAGASLKEVASKSKK
ncbi:MAG: HU family DNA-binding protein [Puniceicoccales bacterium]|jgi:DNA-binding protein HU-beta|nr:HU family DNA-binding protein [Puniceicoccales bacterium]